MASDIGLVLGSEHRDLLVLADQCGRMSRGFQDPVGDLCRRLRAHLVAANEEVYPVLRSLVCTDQVDGLWLAVESARSLSYDSVAREEVAAVTRGLVAAERAAVLPVVTAQMPIAERRRMGKVFRIRRDAVLRSAPAQQHRHRSQTELYELARRAGVEHRSTMTQAQLEAAVAQWERGPGHGVQATG